MAGRAGGQVRQPDEADRPDVVIPVTALFSPEIDGASFVWVIDESSNTASRRQVEVQSLTTAGLVVESGLELGEVVATAGVHFLTEGQQVRPVVE